MSFRLPSVLVLACALAPAVPAAGAPAPLRVLLITGGCCHDYAAQKDLLKKGLEARLHAQVEQLHCPDGGTTPKLAILGNPDYAKGFSVVVHDECAAGISDPKLIEAVLAPHRAGVPGVNLHCAMHSYRVGNPGEAAAAGAARAAWFEYLGVQSSRHGPKKPLEIATVAEGHPALAGLGWNQWTTGNEELYNNVQVFKTATPLQNATQTVKEGQVDKAVVTWVNDYQGTRVFSTSLGHFNETVADPRYLDLVARGLLWAAGASADTHLKPVAK